MASCSPNVTRLGWRHLHLAINLSSRRYWIATLGWPNDQRPLSPIIWQNQPVDNNVQEPSVVFRDNIFELYYIGLGFALPDQGLDAPSQQITSINFMRATFDRDMKSVSLTASSPGWPLREHAEVHYLDGCTSAFTPLPVRQKTTNFIMARSSGNATSDDGITWDDAGIILEPGTEEDFDNWGIMAPTVSFQPDQTNPVLLRLGKNPIIRHSPLRQMDVLACLSRRTERYTATSDALSP